MKYIHIAGHPAPLPLEVGLLILVNNGPKVPEIIELLDWQDQPDQYILVLERPSPCKDLWDFLNFHDGTLNEDTARFIMTQTTMAAHVCCRRGVFHRDIKLENLLINTETYEVKLIDFGCGDLLQESGYEKFRGMYESDLIDFKVLLLHCLKGNNISHWCFKLQTNLFPTGTVDYRPPEYRTEGKYHGKPATVWSLGVLLFLLVCGRFPERRDRRMIDDNTWSMPGLSNECCRLIRSLLQESPRQRIDLREILQHEWFKDTE
ncbi:serine/threonine-protein kinase pim-2-like [Pseudorasbora parva]|uniref:serine/threonine-protein kinase pim-2-like n=1 Tax=Pseudorasbora parva TaxID=51549 RepID=UPI00351DF691